MAELSTGQRKAIQAIVGDDPEYAVTYKEAAESLGITEWTLKTQLQRVRRKTPGIYKVYMQKRRQKLDIRHEEALERQDEHNHVWLAARAKANNRMLRRLGFGYLIPRW